MWLPSELGDWFGLCQTEQEKALEAVLRSGLDFPQDGGKQKSVYSLTGMELSPTQD